MHYTPMGDLVSKNPTVLIKKFTQEPIMNVDNNAPVNNNAHINSPSHNKEEPSLPVANRISTLNQEVRKQMHERKVVQLPNSNVTDLFHKAV
ncbi:MAG: hypothetical protein MRY21_07880 [Simkaniaceae bacterium]|nr:hypothetical protein [Simkaniaceae bacterium]